MKILGVCTGKEDIRWAIATGTQEAPQLLDTERKSQQFPDTVDETKKIMGIITFVSTLLKEKGIDHVRIVTAGHSQFRGPSPSRVKVECAVQVAAAQTGISVEILKAQSLRAWEKRILERKGLAAEGVLNATQAFSPRDWRDAAVVAWAGLPE